MRKFLSFLFITLFSITSTFALEQSLSWSTNTWEVVSTGSLNKLDELSNTSYIYFYWQWCPHCANLDRYLTKVWAYDKLDIVKKEIYFDDENRAELQKYADSFWLKDGVWVPFLIINDWENQTYLTWDTPVIEYFKTYLGEIQVNEKNRAIVITVLMVLAIITPVFLIKLSSKN